MVEAVVKSKHGLHARPASAIVSAAAKFDGDIFIIKDGSRYNAKSIMNILGMGLLYGERVQIEALGKDADKAEAEIKGIVESVEE